VEECLQSSATKLFFTTIAECIHETLLSSAQRRHTSLAAIVLTFKVPSSCFSRSEDEDYAVFVFPGETRGVEGFNRSINFSSIEQRTSFSFNIKTSPFMQQELRTNSPH
jgi:hypothetical protein